jgi:prepilin-type N-terminal cleavage/methylation domain-containing protein
MDARHDCSNSHHSLNLINMLKKPIMKARHAHRQSVRRGLTLLELMMVLAILTGLALLSWPVLSRPFRQQALNQAAADLRTALGQARIQAIESGQSRYFFFEIDGSKFLISDRPTPPTSTDLQASAESRLARGKPPAPEKQASMTRTDSAKENSMEASTQSSDTHGTLPLGIIFASNIDSLYTSQVLPTTAMEFRSATRSLSAESPAETMTLNGAGTRWSKPLVFRPDGRYPKGTMHLAAFDRKWRTVRSEPLSGRIAISPIETWKEEQDGLSP